MQPRSVGLIIGQTAERWNQHLRTAAERCREELARELASLEIP